MKSFKQFWESEKEDILGGLDAFNTIQIELTDLFRYFSFEDSGTPYDQRGAPEYNIDYYLDQWRDKINYDIGFELGVCDDDLCDYEASDERIKDVMSDIIDNTFERYPEVKTTYAPNVTMQDIEHALNEYFGIN